jgi:hypothetical protein
LAHRIARYLLAHQVLDKKDPRFGLFTGGAGTYSQVVAGASLQEVFVADEITWAATEHNIDCYFFLRNLARITENREFTAAAERVKNSLLTTLWSDNLGTFARGMRPTGLDLGNALDCASWGALFLIAIGETEKAQRALQTAERDFASSDSLTGITGHKPYSDAEIFANRDIANYYRKTFPTDNWTAISGVWPEGSAGVALTAFRLGHSSRAVQILSELERLRAARGTLPDFTQAIPQEFDTAPSAAGTAWIELVRREIDQAGNSFLFK